VSQYQKGETNLDLTEARDNEWQWHQLGHMQKICTSLQRNTRASIPPLFFTGRVLFLPPNQQCKSTEGNDPSNSASVFGRLLKTFFSSHVYSALDALARCAV